MKGISTMKEKESTGHISALITIIIWGTTFISTKILLHAFEPVEILFLRFAIGLAALWIASPHRMRGLTKKQELTFAAAGLSGICLYYLLENIALTYTLASNVGVIVSIAPFFIAIISRFLLKGEEKLRPAFFIGFLFAMAGICIISFSGSSLHLDPKGDLLALLAALVWSFYAVFSRKISGYGYSTIQTTRHCFFYGVLFMIPALFLFGFSPDLTELKDPVLLGNLLFLALGASALCYVTWNYSVGILGALKASVYIYLSPVVTVVASVLILHEELTVMTIVGMLLTLVGLFLSEYRR